MINPTRSLQETVRQRKNRELREEYLRQVADREARGLPPLVPKDPDGVWVEEPKE